MTDWQAPALMEFGPVEDCGCVMERWIHRNVELLMHFEPEGIDAFVDGGEWTQDLSFDTRSAAFAWIDALPTEEEWAAAQQAAAL